MCHHKSVFLKKNRYISKTKVYILSTVALLYTFAIFFNTWLKRSQLDPHLSSCSQSFAIWYFGWNIGGKFSLIKKYIRKLSFSDFEIIIDLHAHIGNNRRDLVCPWPSFPQGQHLPKLESSITARTLIWIQ